MAASKVSALTPTSTVAGTDETHISRAGTDLALQLSAVLARSNHTGEEQTADIADDAVTYAKIQNVSATDKLLGRSTAGAGDVEEITCTLAGRELLDDASAAAQLVTLGAAEAVHTHDPTTDLDITTATAGQQLTVNEDEDALVYGLASKYLLVRKATPGTIAAGRPVYIDSYNNAGYVEVEEADASSAATMPAVGVTYEAVTQGGSGSRVLLSGLFVGIDTAGYADGAPLYVSTTAGELTDTKPVGNAQIQKIGQVGRGNINGQLVVSGAGRSNDTPNFTAADKYWYGGTGGVTTEGDITAAARTVLDDASVGDMVATLGGAASTGTGGLVRATSPTLTTPILSGDLAAGGNNIDDSGVLFQNEQAAADADVAGEGQWWTKTATPNRPMFTDDSGQDFELLEEVVGYACSDEDTLLTTGEKVVFYAPYDMTITSVYASLKTAPTVQALTVDVESPAGTSLLTAVLSIGTSSFTDEETGMTKAIAKGARVSIDIDQADAAGAASGLKVFITHVRT